MKKIILFLVLLSPFYIFGQGVTVRRPVGATNSTQLNGKEAAFYIDTITNQNIFGIKIFKTSLQIGDSLFLSFFDTVYKESLNERDFATSAKWTTIGSFSISGGKATFSGTSGTLTQLENRLALTGLGNSKYRFIYTVSNMTGVGCVAFINTDFASSNATLVLVNATDTLTFISNSDPSDFKIECTCTSGGFDLDDFSLKKKSDSIVFIKNDLYAGGIFVEGSSAFSGDVQILGNLKGGSPLTISTPIGEIEIDGDIHLIKDEKNWTLGIDTSDADQFKISNDDTLGINDRLVIDATGNVGIGISAPDAKLRVDQSSEAIALTVVSAALTSDGMKVVADNLTTGSLMLLSSNSASTSTRNLVQIINDNTLATGAVPLRIQQDAIADTFQAFDGIERVFTIDETGNVGIQNGAGNDPQYRLDVGFNSYFAINSSFGHIIQHNSAASTFWSIAPRNGGDLDIAVTTTDPRPTSNTIGTSDNAISIKANKDADFFGNVSSVGFAKKLFKVSTSVFETAVRGTEYNSPNQHGGLYGTVFRKYFAIPDILSAGLTVNIALGLTPNDVLQIGGYVVENTSGDKILIGSGSGNTASNLGMHVQVVGSNLELDANDALDWNSGECWIDYTK